MDELVLYIILGIIIAEYVVDRVLHHLNERNWRSTVPTSLKDFYKEDEYQEARQYDKANANLSFYSTSFNTLLILGVLWWGGFALVDEWVRQWSSHPVWLAILFFGVIGIIGDILNLPFQWYSTFSIEERFDFNRTNISTFVLDKLKSYVLGAVIGGGLLALIVWFYLLTGAQFWIWAWLIITAFTLLFTMFYTSLIVPLFNKLTPLEEGELRTAIEEYCQKVDFPLNDIYVMDGSKRSSKANAFFSGLGKKKSIVLFDTLIDNHTTDELVSILAHEVGHYKKKHIYKSLVLSTIQIFIMLFIFSYFIDSPVLAQALGAEQPSFHLSLLAFMLLYSPISTLTGLLMNAYSRKNEFEADRFARETADGKALQEALKKLSVDHLSNLHPHKAYVIFHYSHPPLLDRLNALQS
jgi:STE24 endopeptidase